jgi:5,10-methylenetetrahydromethanopterin reductase
MLSARKRLPDLAFSSPPSFLVGRRRRARYDSAAIELMSHHR